MVTRTNTVHRRASIIFDQMKSASEYAPSDAERSKFLESDDNPYLQLLNKLYAEDFALARLMDSADLVVHAEGPAARDPSPQLRAVNWLCQGVDRNLRSLATAALNLSGPDAKRLSRKVDLRLTGFAPGSLYAGFAVNRPEKQLAGLPDVSEDDAYLAITEAIHSLPQVPRFVRDEYFSEEIRDVIPDPAMRDASIVTAYNLAPTGKIGIHTLEIAAPRQSSTTLSQRERVVLKDVARRPVLNKIHRASFIGEMRGVDLDTNRFHLRNIPDIGTVRCISPLSAEASRYLLGRTVKVTGEYESDASGRPRLMRVFEVEEVDMPVQHHIEDLL
ncbi:hypothetical protein [Cupriavidus gilardii]|uniref:Uncharacterized protein n=1 Tax=Cupriavidus gilardii TaxID=82541 RepID=A0A849BJG5_9BURK|nr:hypothetical protein [Cupriavidus gilardii]KAB0592790.1 hypothetical protein F7Q96_26000 [Cupriavidus gilardii]NNH14284.1 hypothetical protein [Cupriavidus gilardii]